MAVLRFSITKREHEWTQVESLIESTFPNKRFLRGKGFSTYLSREIGKMFKPNGKKCDEVKVAHIKKSFCIKIDDEIAQMIECEAQKLGVDPGVLIAKKILDPHLNINTTTTVS